MDFITAIKTCFKKYAVFSGRARRSEFWFFYLFLGIIGMIIMLIIVPIFTSQTRDFLLTMEQTKGMSPAEVQVAYWNALAPLHILESVLFVFIIPFMIPLFAAMVRRLHDTGRSGALLILAFILWANIVLFVFLLMDSQPGENKYGPNPKGINQEDGNSTTNQ